MALVLKLYLICIWELWNPWKFILWESSVGKNRDGIWEFIKYEIEKLDILLDGQGVYTDLLHGIKASWNWQCQLAANRIINLIKYDTSPCLSTFRKSVTQRAWGCDALGI